MDWPIYVNKEELTTVTLFYDAYYDFGIAGVISVFISIGSGCRMAFCKDIPGKKSGVVPILFSGSALFYALVFYNLVFQSYDLVLLCGDRCLWNFFRD